MRIGIVPELGGGGGIYQYSLAVLSALGDWLDRDGKDELVVFSDQADHPALLSLNGHRWNLKPLTPPPEPPSTAQRGLNAAKRLLGDGPHKELLVRIRRRLFPAWWERDSGTPDPALAWYYLNMGRWLHRSGVDLMVYPAHNVAAFETGPPYVMVVHDLQHRLQPEFPEVSADGEWERREEFFRRAIGGAAMIVTDSEVGKEDVLSFYGTCGITPDRIEVLPFVPAPYLSVERADEERRRVSDLYHLPERYLFYPAQFWPHKNHARILRALALIQQQHGLKIPIVFCGSRPDAVRERTYQELVELTARLELDDQVRHLGYASDEDMSGLYAGATALIMPTFFGPTNIPVLEAWAFGCPVLTSDIRGIREQAGDAALLADPRSEQAIADAMHRLWTDGDLRLQLGQRGRRRLASYTPADFSRRFGEILANTKSRVHHKA
jgi:glycosyltransferase involved in cell wall biosynthesis